MVEDLLLCRREIGSDYLNLRVSGRSSFTLLESFFNLLYDLFRLGGILLHDNGGLGKGLCWFAYG